MSWFLVVCCHSLFALLVLQTLIGGSGPIGSSNKGFKCQHEVKQGRKPKGRGGGVNVSRASRYAMSARNPNHYHPG